MNNHILCLAFMQLTCTNNDSISLHMSIKSISYPQTRFYGGSWEPLQPNMPKRGRTGLIQIRGEFPYYPNLRARGHKPNIPAKHSLTFSWIEKLEYKPERMMKNSSSLTSSETGMNLPWFWWQLNNRRDCSSVTKHYFMRNHFILNYI